MANRIYNPELAIEKQVVHMYATFMIGAAGAVGTFTSIGIASATKLGGDGAYTITMSDLYDKLLFVNITPVSSAVGGSLVTSAEVATAPASLQTDFKAGTFDIQFYDNAGAAINAANGTMVMIEVIARRSSVGPA